MRGAAHARIVLPTATGRIDGDRVEMRAQLGDHLAQGCVETTRGGAPAYLIPRYAGARAILTRAVAAEACELNAERLAFWLCLLLFEQRSGELLDRAPGGRSEFVRWSSPMRCPLVGRQHVRLFCLAMRNRL